MCVVVVSFFFFFQAEDGIRDESVTGVQTCALPIWSNPSAPLIPGGSCGGPAGAQHPASRPAGGVMTETAQGRPALAGFHHFSITATDVDASVAWYQRVLGLQP